jgi:heme/copper-type cytochrome/quinol oxidase subunit 2
MEKHKKLKEEERKPNSKLRMILMENLLVIFMVISVIVGIVLGIALRSVWSPDERRKLHYLRFPGFSIVSVYFLK